MKMMKFSELVQCWGPPETSQRSEDEAAAETEDAAVSRTSGGESRRRGESSGKGSSSSSGRHAVVWRPSLGAIYEDKTAAKGGAKTVEERGRRKERAEKSRREVAPAKSRSQKVRDRDDRDRYGQVGVPTAIPAFTPTAFLF